MSDTATARKIKQTLKTIFDNPLKGDDVILAIVKSVDEVEGTCVVDPVDESAQLFDIRLQAETGKGVLIIPKIGSTVIVTMINNVNGHVTMFSDVEKIVLLDGSFGGIVKAQEVSTKLNNLENAFNDLVVKFNTHVHVTTCPAGAGSAAPTVSPETTVLTPTNENEIQNELIKHGKN